MVSVFALTSREATSKETPAGSRYSGVCWGKSGRESFSLFGTSHRCSPVWILWCLLHGCATRQPSHPPAHLLSHTHGCGTGRKKELQPDTRSPWVCTVLTSWIRPSILTLHEGITVCAALHFPSTETVYACLED